MGIGTLSRSRADTRVPDPAYSRRPRPRWRRWLRRLLVAAAACLALVAAAVVVLWPTTPGVADLPARVSNELAAHHTRTLSALPRPDRVGTAVVATENSRFWSDPGVDVISLARVAIAAAHGKNTGGATLEQQLAKLEYGPGWPGLLAKVEQLELGLKIADTFSKPEILRLYLSAAYYGNGYYGVSEAARGYFGVPVSQLSWGQAALLAGLVQAPSAYDPYHHFRLAREREQEVLARLVDIGRLTPAQAHADYAASLRLRPATG